MKKNLVIIILLSLFLTACGQNRQEEPIQEDSQQTVIPETAEKKNWVIEEQVLPDADTAIGELIPENGEIFTEEWYLVNETVYRVISFVNSDDSVAGEEFFKGHCVQKLEAPYLEWTGTYIAPEEWVEGEFCEPWIYGDGGSVMTEKGLVVLLEGKNGTYLGEWDEESGTAAREIDRSLLLTDDSEKYANWKMARDGGLDLWDSGTYIHMDGSFAVKDRLEPEKGLEISTVTENNQDGKTYLIYSAEISYDGDMSSPMHSGIQFISVDGTQVLLSSMDIHAGGDDITYFTTETDGYLYQNFCIAEFSLEEGKIDILYNFSNDTVFYDKMYNPHKALKYMSIRNGIQGGYVRGDGFHILLVACGDGTWQIWRMHDDGKQTVITEPEKKVLEWATTIPGIYGERAVARFNMQSMDYEIVFRLPDEGEDFEDFRNRIRAELAAGGGPDILTGQSVINMEDGVRMGVLSDLTDYFAEYGEAMLPSAWQMGVVEGKRYSVPYSYTITTLVADKGLLGSRDRWTLDEAMGYMEDSGASYFAAGMDEAQIFCNLGLVTETDSRLVDWKNNICHLDSDKAAELLKFAERFADNEGTEGNAYLRTAEGKAATAILYLMGPEDMRVAAVMFGDREAYIGFPAGNGESGHILHDSSLMVNQASPNVEGAVAFIQFLLSEETQSDMADRLARNASTGFPIRNSAMEQVYDYLQKEEESPGELRIYGGLEYEAMPLSDESIQKLKELVNSARPLGNKAPRLYEIVEEEIKNFRAEGKTEEQVLDVVNNRVQLYLNELGY